MASRGRSRARAVLLLLIGVLLGAATYALAVEITTNNIRETSRSDGTPILSIRPTGVGLPEVGAEGTVGLGDYAAEVKAYVNAGAYQRDLEAVGARARAYVAKRIRILRRRAARRCRRARQDGVGPKKLEKACRKPKLALVFDIDETSVSNYECLAASDFKEATPALVACAAQATSPAIAPSLELTRFAKQKNVAFFFITGRPEEIPMARERTVDNLRYAGYEGWTDLILAPAIDVNTPEYKSGARAEIEKKGYRIIANLGDQESDLQLGHADRAFKYPNPFYFIGE